MFGLLADVFGESFAVTAGGFQLSLQLGETFRLVPFDLLAAVLKFLTLLVALLPEQLGDVAPLAVGFRLGGGKFLAGGGQFGPFRLELFLEFIRRGGERFVFFSRQFQLVPLFGNVLVGVGEPRLALVELCPAGVELVGSFF